MVLLDWITLDLSAGPDSAPSYLGMLVDRRYATECIYT
jgi:hypothetical protein